MGAGKILAGIFAPLAVSVAAGWGAGEAYYNSRVDGLAPRQVQVTWQNKEETYDKKVVTTTTEELHGLGTADVTGKVLAGRDLVQIHQVLPPGQALPENTLFQGKPSVVFQDNDAARTRNLFQLGGLCIGYLGVLGSAAFFCRKREF